MPGALWVYAALCIAVAAFNSVLTANGMVAANAEHPRLTAAIDALLEEWGSHGNGSLENSTSNWFAVLEAMDAALHGLETIEALSQAAATEGTLQQWEPSSSSTQHRRLSSTRDFAITSSKHRFIKVRHLRCYQSNPTSIP